MTDGTRVRRTTDVRSTLRNGSGGAERAELGASRELAAGSENRAAANAIRYFRALFIACHALHPVGS